MPGDDWYSDLLDRVARNDDAAVAEFVSRYQNEIRTMVRAWLRPWETKLRQLFDSEDICQSILALFFLKNAATRYNLDSPEQLRKLFMVMVRNRVYDHVRRVKPDRGTVSLVHDAPARQTKPEDELVDKELREYLISKLSPEEADIAERRIRGSTWQEIAEAIGGNADARRMQFTRLANRLLAQPA
jgi:RNA polymerase sigma factor (sigma-70 family)